MVIGRSGGDEGARAGRVRPVGICWLFWSSGGELEPVCVVFRPLRWLRLRLVREAGANRAVGGGFLGLFQVVLKFGPSPSDMDSGPPRISQRLDTSNGQIAAVGGP